MSSSKKRSPWKGKGGIVMAAVVVILGVLFFVDQKAPPPRDPDSPPPVSDFAHMRAEDVSRVEVKRAEGGFALAKKDGKWTFEQPAGYQADSQNVDTWLKGTLDDALVNRVVEGKPGDLAGYGLDKPAAELVLTSKGGDTRTIQTGNGFKSSPTDTGTPSVFYAREAKDGRLFMLSASQVESIKTKKVDELRDKHLVEMPDEKDVQSIRIDRKAGPLEVQRRGEDKWELTQPFTAPAEKFDAEGLVSQLKTTEADSFAADNTSDLPKYGLDQPRLTVTVTGKKGSSAVLFGKETKDGKVYAMRQGGREVALVAKSTFEGLDKKPADLRDRELITLASDKITAMELRNSHGTVKVNKTAGGGTTNWELEGATDPKAKTAKADRVQQVLNSITSPAFKHVEENPADLAKYGLDKPEITVTVNEGAGTSQVFQLGKKTKDGNYYAKGLPNAVFAVQPYVYSDLNVTPDAFKDTAKK